jgi:outer membrane protein assembly factor BamB
LAALLKRDGSVRWAISLAPEKKQQEPRVLYGPILAGNALLVLDAEGTLTTYKPDTGQKLGSFELTSRIASSPVIANGALYVMTKDARLYKYF